MFDVVSYVTAVVPYFFAIVFLFPEFPLTHTQKKDAESFGKVCPWDAGKKFWTFLVNRQKNPELFKK